MAMIVHSTAIIPNQLSNETVLAAPIDILYVLEVDSLLIE